MMKFKTLCLLILCALQMACGTLFEKPDPASGQSKQVKPALVDITPLPKLEQEPIVIEQQEIEKKPQVVSVPSKPASPAVLALLGDAQQNSSGGNLDAAVSSIERALRIEPRNPLLYYQLAEVRLKQEKPRLAEDLANKCVLLSGRDLVLKRKAWLLIAQARQLQGNEQGVEDARNKAAGLEIK